MTQDDDPTTHEVRYTAEVGRDIEGAGGKSLLMAASPQLAQDVRAAFAGVPRVKPQWTDRHLKILVVGESGLGARNFFCLCVDVGLNCFEEMWPHFYVLRVRSVVGLTSSGKHNTHHFVMRLSCCLKVFM